MAAKVFFDAHVSSRIGASTDESFRNFQLNRTTSSAAAETAIYRLTRAKNVGIQNQESASGFGQLIRGNSPAFVASSTSSHSAYAFLVGGCNPQNGRYLGFLYNVMVASRILKEEGSNQDVVLLVQMSSNSSTTALPVEQIRALEGLGVRLYYVPPSSSRHESFYDTALNKFRILQLIQYKKVMLLDADVMPLGNLDYLFRLEFLRPNVVVSGALEPANGGIFVLSPAQGEYEQLQEIMLRRERHSGRTYFDPGWGWGHTIRHPDKWVARRPGIQGTNWTFHFAFSDQGLLYHWTKYVKRDVSIVFEDRVENWGAPIGGGMKGKVGLEETIRRPFNNYSKPRLRVYAMCRKFLCDIMHFSGTKKPWLRKPPKDLSDVTKEKDVFYLWWYTLQQIDKTAGLELDYEHWRTWQEQPLGNYATMPDS